MTPDFDVAVIGGGPAGSVAAAMAARQGARVVLLERGAIERDKVCGEFVSAEALPLIEALAPEVLDDAPTVDAVGLVSRGGRGARFRLHRPGRGISRLCLDPALWRSAAAAGADTRAHVAVAAVSGGAGDYRLQLSRGGPVRAAYIVVAAGRWWHIPGLGPAADAPREQPRQRLAPVSPWIGVKARFKGMPASESVNLYAFRGGYCGLSPVENGWINAAVLLHRQALGRPGCELGASRDFAVWLERVAQNSSLSARLRRGHQVSVTVVTAPVRLGRMPAALGPVLLCGDAAGFVDPFTGDGLARAMLSGQLAASLLESPERYRATLRRAAGFGLSAGLRPLLLAPEWVQRPALAGLRASSLGPWLVSRTRWHTL